jgi:branched-chain amino acid transport system permease protein
MRPCGVFDERYETDMAIVRTWQHWTILLGTMGFLFSIPLFASYYLISLLNSIFITSVMVLGLQIIMGYCGQVSLGQAAFMAIGGFVSALLTLKLGLSFWLALPLSGLSAGLIGLIGGAPSLRIKEFYLAMSTVAIHYVIIWLITHLKITGYTQGLVVSPPAIGNFVFNTEERMYYIILMVTLLMTFCARNLIRGNVGRIFIAIRDNDLASEVMGVNIFKYKMLAFFISCFYAGIAGSLLAHWYQVVNAEMFTLNHALLYIGMIIIGGMGSIPGAFFGVFFLRLLDELVLAVSPMLAHKFPQLGMTPAASLGVMCFGIVLVFFLLFEPRGIAHRWEIFKASYRIYPYRK